MKQEQGIVMETAGGTAQVRIARHEECGSCGACGGAQRVVVEAANPVEAKAGDKVIFEFREENVLTGAFVVFILPLIFGAVGAVVGHFAAPFLDESGSLPYVLGALIFFLIALGVVKKFDKQAARNQALKPVIVKILGSRQQ